MRMFGIAGQSYSRDAAPGFLPPMYLRNITERMLTYDVAFCPNLRTAFHAQFGPHYTIVRAPVAN